MVTRFGVGQATYDGHRADVGRVVCDSTWHHFVNVNLTGIFEGRENSTISPVLQEVRNQ